MFFCNAFHSTRRAELLCPDTSFSHMERRYRLHAIIFHVGRSADSGHYTIAVRTDSAPQSATQFLYFDDTRACLVRGRDAVHRLLCTHQPLNTHSAQFQSLAGPRTGDDAGSIVTQSRTPYILVYESLLHARKTNPPPFPLI